MEQSLFRQKSMDRISSPEQLNDYLRVTSPAVWVILTAIILLLAGLLIWSATATINTYAAGTAEVRDGFMTVRFDDPVFAKNVEQGMEISVDGQKQAVVQSVGTDENGLVFATAATALTDGFYASVRVTYKQTQVLRLLFD